MNAVTLHMPAKPLFVGSYRRIPVEIDPTTGLTLDDLDFQVLTVTGGLEGGVVSRSRDAGFDPANPEVMLCAGASPGWYRVEVLERSSSAVVGEGKFGVEDHWRDDDVGPPLWLTGAVESFSPGSAWGGGPTTPQNLSVASASGVRRVAVLLLDTSSHRYPADSTLVAAMQARWSAETEGGVTHGGVANRSVKSYFREVSYGNFDVDAEVFGPVQLPGSWEDYFELNGWAWVPKGSAPQSFVSACDSVVDYRNFDSVVFVTPVVPATATTPAKGAWPVAWRQVFSFSEGGRSLTRSMGWISFPNEWGLTGDREIYETLSHELGHNLGLGDQYAPAIRGRNPTGWDMMDNDDWFPHFSLPHRMMLGWVRSHWLKLYNFAESTNGVGEPRDVDETVVLHAVELGAPPANRYAGIEIRVSPGWNYYLEYRASQAGQVADRNLPMDRSVLGTDVISPSFMGPEERPTVLLLNVDASGNDAVIGDGQHWEVNDRSDPSRPRRFRVDVSGVDGNKANVRIRYDVNARPDPMINRWPAGPGRQWQSPDIEVRNARNMADPAWRNVPWSGHDNTVVGRVSNRGRVDAPRVTVEFGVKNFNVGGAPEVPLAFDLPRDVPAGGRTEFSTTWRPPEGRHYCVVARIPQYVHPTTGVPEMTENNNLAQSNYDRFISRTSSPPSREITQVEVGNPFDKPTRFFLLAGQSNPLYRTYIEHTWVRLKPGETREIGVMFEYTIDPSVRPDPSLDENYELREFENLPNNVGVVGLIEDPRKPAPDAPLVMAGAQVEVITGRATKFENLEVEQNAIRGSVVAVDDGSPVPGGKVLFVVSSEDEPDAERYGEADIWAGKFEWTPQWKWRSLQPYFLPPAGYADCSAEPIPRV